MNTTNTQYAINRAIQLCEWIAETPHQRGSINGLAAQVRHELSDLQSPAPQPTGDAREAAFEAWWATLEDAPWRDGVQRGRAWAAWQAAQASEPNAVVSFDSTAALIDDLYDKTPAHASEPSVTERRVVVGNWVPVRDALEAAYKQLGRTANSDGYPTPDWNLAALIYSYTHEQVTTTKCLSCSKTIATSDAYRCFDCKGVLCERCAPEHFGPNHAARALASHGPLAAPARAVEPLKFDMPTNWELSWGSDDEESPGEWRVHVRVGSRNDREWLLLGSGPTPEAAIKKARGIPATTPTKTQGGEA